jgi:uncharacterized RDD family membrane protein YckC
MTQPPQDPQNPWENPGGGTPPQGGNPYQQPNQPPDQPPNQPPPGNPYQQPQQGNPYDQPHQGGPSFGKDQPGPYGGQGGGDPFGAPQNPYGQGGQQPPPGGTPPGYGQNPYGGGVPPYSGGQDPYGQQPGGSPMIASKWKRLGGIIIDSIVFGVISCCVTWPFRGNGDYVIKHADGSESVDWGGFYSGGQIFGTLVAAALAFLYFWLLTNRWNGQTLGKKAMNIRVVREDTGGPIDSQMSGIRAGVFVVLSYICYCGGLLDAIWIFTNPKNQTLHDKLAKTVVVEANGSYAPGGYSGGQPY